MPCKPLKLEEFKLSLETEFAHITDNMKSVAVGLSGGPDSMALTWLLCEWAKNQNSGPKIHALTVDHGLRTESADEALQVGESVKDWPDIQHIILRNNKVYKASSNLTSKASLTPPKNRVMENARRSRYGLLSDYCKKHSINYLFLAHHQNDQAETFLFRLAKGSGLDGLTCMKLEQNYNRELTLVRPFLHIPKDRLVATCKFYDLPCVDDPSNICEDYSRPRMRKSWEVLETEGITAKRLSVTAKRLNRARLALNNMAEIAMNKSIIEKETDHIIYKLDVLRTYPEEIVLRVIIKAIEYFRKDADYLPRMEKIETLSEGIIYNASFRKRTLGGLIFERNDKAGLVKITQEKQRA